MLSRALESCWCCAADRRLGRVRAGCAARARSAPLASAASRARCVKSAVEWIVKPRMGYDQPGRGPRHTSNRVSSRLTLSRGGGGARNQVGRSGSAAVCASVAYSRFRSAQSARTVIPVLYIFVTGTAGAGRGGGGQRSCRMQGLLPPVEGGGAPAGERRRGDCGRVGKVVAPLRRLVSSRRQSLRAPPPPERRSSPTAGRGCRARTAGSSSHTRRALLLCRAHRSRQLGARTFRRRRHRTAASTATPRVTALSGGPRTRRRSEAPL